ADLHCALVSRKRDSDHGRRTNKSCERSRGWGQYRMAARAGCRVCNHRATVPVARKRESVCRVLAEQCEGGRMRAVRHRERAAEMVLCFFEGVLRLFAEGYAPEIDLLVDAGR